MKPIKAWAIRFDTGRIWKYAHGGLPVLYTSRKAAKRVGNKLNTKPRPVRVTITVDTTEKETK